MQLQTGFLSGTQTWTGQVSLLHGITLTRPYHVVFLFDSAAAGNERHEHVVADVVADGSIIMYFCITFLLITPYH